MSELYFDTEIFKKDTSIYSSLEELSGYSVFSEEFYERMQEIRINEKKELDARYEAVFTEDAEDTITEDYMLVMQAPQQLVIRNEVETTVENGQWSIFIYMAVGMLLAVAGTLLFSTVKRMRDNKK